MKIIVLFLALVELLLCHKGSARFLDEDCGFKKTNITFRDSSTAPWMALVRNEHKFLCGGTLITKNIVLTAAHCIDGSGQLFVKLGVFARDMWQNVEIYNVIRAIKHPDFDLKHFSNDIGLLRLHAEVQYTDLIRPICIVMDGSINLQNINQFTLYGWGKTKKSQSSNFLKDMPYSRRSPEDCSITRQFTDKQICARGTKKSKAGKGDDGGPLAAIREDRHVQVGVFSKHKSYGVFTNVAGYKDWIASNVRSISQANTSYPGIEGEKDSTKRTTRLLYEGCSGSRGQGLPSWTWEVYELQNRFAGTLITDRYVVTAARAVDNCSVIILKTNWDQRLRVDSIIEHPRFRQEQNRAVNNIALLRLDQRVETTNLIRPICVDLDLDPEWEFSNRYPESGKEKDFYVCSPLVCRIWFWESVADYRQFCVWDQTVTSKTPGSALIVSKEIRSDRELFLVGIFSHKVSAVFAYTNIQSHLSWIQNTIKNSTK